MRFLADIVGFLIFLAGLAIALGGCILGVPFGPAGLIVGGVMMMAGWLLGHFVSTRTCPACRSRVSHKALRCRHYGEGLAGAAV